MCVALPRTAPCQMSYGPADLCSQRRIRGQATQLPLPHENRQPTEHQHRCYTLEHRYRWRNPIPRRGCRQWRGLSYHRVVLHRSWCCSCPFGTRSLVMDMDYGLRTLHRVTICDFLLLLSSSLEYTPLYVLLPFFTQTRSLLRP